MRARALAVVVLTALWMLTLASTYLLDVVLGLLVSTAVVTAVPGTRSVTSEGDPPPLGRRLLAFPGFVLATLREVAVGTWDLTLRVLHLRPVDRPGIVLVPIGERTRAGLAATALADTLSPGEVLIDIDHERGVMLVHVIDAHDPDEVRARHERFYERHQRGVFP